MKVYFTFLVLTVLIMVCAFLVGCSNSPTLDNLVKTHDQIEPNNKQIAQYTNIIPMTQFAKYDGVKIRYNAYIPSALYITVSTVDYQSPIINNQTQLITDWVDGNTNYILTFNDIQQNEDGSINFNFTIGIRPY